MFRSTQRRSISGPQVRGDPCERRKEPQGEKRIDNSAKIRVSGGQASQVLIHTCKSRCAGLSDFCPTISQELQIIQEQHCTADRRRVDIGRKSCIHIIVSSGVESNIRSVEILINKRVEFFGKRSGKPFTVAF